MNDPSRGSGDHLDRFLSALEDKIDELQSSIRLLVRSSVGQITTTTVGPGGVPSRVQIAAENKLRTGAIISNQGGSKVLIFFGNSEAIVMEIPPNDIMVLPCPAFTGSISAARSSGTNPVVFTELVSAEA